MPNEEDMEEFFRYKPPPSPIPPAVPITTVRMERKLDRIIYLLELLTKKEDLEYVKKFNTGITNLPNAVIPATGQTIDPANTTPTTGYTVVNVYTELTPNRMAKELFFLNLGPGTIFVIIYHGKSEYIAQEFPVFARNATIFHEVYELRIRTDLANTRFVASEHPLTSLPAQQFADRDATPRHLRQPFTTFAPHGQTIRQSYTVPTGFQAQVSGIYAFVDIETDAAIPGRRNMTIGYSSTVSGAPITGSILSRSIPHSKNFPGDLVDEAGGIELGFAYLLQEGETINISTGDSSTGGTANYFGSVLITEYFPIG